MTTTRRTIRIDDDTWRDWHIAANKAGVSRSVFIRDTMNARLKGDAVMLASDLPHHPRPDPGIGSDESLIRTIPPLKLPKLKRTRTPKRTIDPASGMCEHRVSADAYCPKCEKEKP